MTGGHSPSVTAAPSSPPGKVTVFSAKGPAFSWRQPFDQEDCTDSGKRQFSSILINIPEGVNGELACTSTPGTISTSGLTWSFPRPARCIRNSTSIRGEFDVPDSYCSRNSDYFDKEPPHEPGVFSKVADGTITCDANCANLGGNWGPPGMCLEARIDSGMNASKFIRCVDKGRDFGASAVTCYCRSQPLGFADTHNHQFANLAFGGKFIWGKPYGSIGEALAQCTLIHSLGFRADVAGTIDAVAQGGRPEIPHRPEGYPNFTAWPRYDTVIHQRIYEDWLYRAYQGGLRLMVMFAVNNEEACNIVGPKFGRSCGDDEAIRYQIRSAKAMERYIDEKSGGRGQGWYRIVYSSKDARTAIANNQLAVILGIEVDKFLDCPKGSSCTLDDIRQRLEFYKQMGVRHVFPIHFLTNGFGGDALFSLANHGPERDCGTEGYRYKHRLLPLLTDPPKCNAEGLTPLGISLLKELMKEKMIIDIDHMSALAKSDALDVFEKYDYPPISSHTGLLAVTSNDRSNEANLDAQEIERVKHLGGMINVILSPGQNLQDTLEYHGQQVPVVRLQCGLSSQNFAQHYLYTIERMQNQAVGLGTDFNILVEPGPRFAGNCQGGGPTRPQTAQVKYPFPVSVKGSPAGLDKSTIGRRTFDINRDGVAHVGMLPDLIEDLKQEGVRPQDLEPLYDSAEGYIKLWERIEATNIH